MNTLTDALVNAGKELAKDYAWSFDGNPGSPPTAEDPFVTVVAKHVAPLLNTEEGRLARIAVLRAELAVLEKEGES